MRPKLYWANVSAYVFLSVSALVFTYVVGYANGVSTARQSVDYPILYEARALLKQYYLGELPPDSNLDYGAVRGLLTAIGDPYTVFLEPPSQELEAQSLQGEFGGIGVSLRRNETGEMVVSPFPDYPAAQAGIQEGDVLVAVDGWAITPEMTTDEVSALVRGSVGTAVKVTVRHGADAPREVELVRVKVEIPSVTSRVLEQDVLIGLVAISRFSEKTPEETQQVIDDLQSRGIVQVILDLRGNGGGLLDSAINTASLFFEGGVIMYEDQHGEAERVVEATGVGLEAGLPLAVLVNHGTASAAEILAGALRDRGRAPLIGQPTYGKGSVQLIFELSDHSSIHITNARWFTPGRAQIDGVGLKPDIEMAPGADGADPELDRAILYLQSLR